MNFNACILILHLNVNCAGKLLLADLLIIINVDDKKKSFVEYSLMEPFLNVLYKQIRWSFKEKAKQPHPALINTGFDTCNPLLTSLECH